ncbi:Hypothetical protein CINCED_3A005436 [Cinara cedri]|nr:Hypothetical protein CINCED_3A005436 [Cinara cedri]
MENSSQHLVALIHNKSDIGTQCELTNDFETVSCKSENCLVEENNQETSNEVILEKKRKLKDWIEHIKKPKKCKLNSVQARPGTTNEKFNETSYYFENGLRKVYPYFFTFTTFTKGRWVGRTLVDVFGEEFRAHTTNEYEEHVKNGSLTINNERVTSDYVFKHNDLLANIVHRHEVPVTNDTIDIIHLDKDIVVVNKPASIPVHPCGRYRHNTIIFLLAKEYNLKDLKTIHRLDRLTSGVLMFGRTQNKARIMESQIRNREVKKQYVCRVEGKFPEFVQCKEPIEVVSYKIGVCKVSSKGKECETIFKLIGYNNEINTSVVLCTPLSGRMHQIRVHLQYLGYPIKNDTLYNDTIFGPEKGRGGNFGKTDEQLIDDLIHVHNAENWKTNKEIPLLPEVINNVSDQYVDTSHLEKITSSSPESMYYNMSTQTGIQMPDMKFDKKKLSIDPNCVECKISYKDPTPKDLIMYLHAFKYSGPDWAYETPLPVWADVNWKEP